MDDTRNRKTCLWAVLLAWVPRMIVLSYSFVGINNSKATGLAAFPVLGAPDSRRNRCCRLIPSSRL